MLTGSTNKRTPFDSYTWSPEPPASSIISPYWKPEHPPPWTNTRSPLPVLPSSANNSLIFVAAVGDTLIIEISPQPTTNYETTNPKYTVLQSGRASTADPPAVPYLTHRTLVTYCGQLPGRP